MARETIFETQKINDFAYSSSWGAYAWHTTPSPFVLELGETYIISWDGEEFERTAFDFSVAAPGAVGVGNAYLAGVSPEPDLVPFIIAYLDTTDYIEFITSASGGHTVAIYKEIAEPEKIVIKDPNGNDVEYPDKPMIRLNTTKGTALYSKGEVLDSITIEPDFSAGDMTVTAPDGYLVQSAVIAKPENLKPENIAKNKVVAGIVGTHEGGGGGGAVPCVFIRFNSLAKRVNKSGAVTNDISMTLPASSVILGIHGGKNGSGSSSSSSTVTAYRRNTDNNRDAIISPSISYPTEDTQTLTFAQSFSTYSCKIMLNLAIVLFSLPGLFLVANDDGIVNICADSNAKELPNHAAILCNKAEIGTIDLSNSNVTKIPTYFMYMYKVKEVKLPACLTSIESYALYGYSTSLKVLDFSLATSVPSLGSYAIGQHDSLQILVPSALYDEWIAATNWSALADYIVAK